MPKLLIHAGMPKAGSTALQARLRARRPVLRKNGILYPSKLKNHNFLVADVMPVGSLPRIFRQHYRANAGTLRSDFDAFWSQILEQIVKTSPDVVVLSGENFWAIDKDEATLLRRRLTEISDDIHIVCYVRKPSDFYLSSAQQRIKASQMLPKLGGVRYKPSLQALKRLGTHLHVHPFVRESFVDGDVCLDFAERHLGNRALLAEKADDGVKNESLSAEAMAILQDYRSHAHPDDDKRFTRDTGELIRQLRDLSRSDRPRLHPEIGAIIDNCSTDLIWLRDTYDITFSGIDYDNIKPIEEKPMERVSDICPIDEDKKSKLVSLLLAKVIQENFNGEPQFNSLFKNKKKKSA